MNASIGEPEENFEAVFRAAVQIKRVDIFGTDDDQVPESEPADAMIPQIGYIGSSYSRGGDMLLAINPGGGGASYRRTAEDAALLPRIEAFRRGEAVSPQELSDLYSRNMRTWNLWRIVKPVLDVCGRSQEDVVYLNWCPFRTRDDRMPRAAAMRHCGDLYVLASIDALAPSRVIALGKKIGVWLEKTPLAGVQKFVVARTIGDTYLSAEALGSLESIRELSQRSGPPSRRRPTEQA